MPGRLFACLLFAVCLLPAGQKTVTTAKGENQDLALTVPLYIDPADVKELIGNDLDGHYIVADVKVEPKYGKEVAIDRDDFQLRTDKDGEKAKPFEPSQIAGRGAMIVHQEQQGRTGGAVGAGSPSSYPGNYPGGGYPYPNGGGSMAGVGSEGDAGTTAATVQNGAGDKENPLEQTLKDKVLPEKKTDQPVSGLLYFVMEKQKLKDLELTYGGKENRIILRFK